MATSETNSTDLAHAEILWKTADTLRGQVDAAEYKHVVLGLLFLKYISDAFEARREELKVELQAEGIADPQIESLLENRDEYTAVASVSVGKLDGVQRVPFAEAPSRARRRVRHGDTIWSCVRPNRRSYLFIHSPPANRIASTGFAVLSPTSFGASYLHELTTRQEFVAYLVANADGSAYPAVRPEHFAAADVLVPPAVVRIAFETGTMPLRDLLSAGEAESEKLAEMRDYLLPKLLSGQVRVEVAHG